MRWCEENDLDLLICGLNICDLEIRECRCTKEALDSGGIAGFWRTFDEQDEREGG